MKVLLKTRVRPELAARLKSAAQADGKSIYRVLRELVEDYANQKVKVGFACERYPERFELPPPSRLKLDLRRRIQGRLSKGY
jgi:hypothetical protein